MHPNSIGSELLAVFAQRLAKRICPSCRVRADPEPALVKDVFLSGVPEGFTCFRGSGCDHCGGYGSFGRIAVVEYLPVTSTLRRAVSRKVPVDEMRDVALDEGFVSMREHALSLVRKGTIALDELPVMFSVEQLRGAPPGVEVGE
jgi:type IV pilus assembly protein PilB